MSDRATVSLSLTPTPINSKVPSFSFIGKQHWMKIFWILTVVMMNMMLPDHLLCSALITYPIL